LRYIKNCVPAEPANLENAEQLITNTFSDNRRYDLANVGRYKVNKKMGWRQRLMGKELMEPICETTADGKKGKVILRAGTIIDDEAIDKIEQSGVYSKPAMPMLMLSSWINRKRLFSLLTSATRLEQLLLTMF